MIYDRAPRFADWPQRLDTHLRARACTPFEWGHNDCCSFACDGVLLMTGSDPMRPLRGRYTSERGARRLISSAGGLQPLVCRYLGVPMEDVRQASRGDLVLVPNQAGDGPALGICVGAMAASAGVAGVVLSPMSAVLAAWRI
jgi:hypothetical protein